MHVHDGPANVPGFGPLFAVESQTSQVLLALLRHLGLDCAGRLLHLSAILCSGRSFLGSFAISELIGICHSEINFPEEIVCCQLRPEAMQTWRTAVQSLLDVGQFSGNLLHPAACKHPGVPALSS